MTVKSDCGAADEARDDDRRLRGHRDAGQDRPLQQPAWPLTGADSDRGSLPQAKNGARTSTNLIPSDDAGHSIPIAALASPDLDALFWRVERPLVDSTWHGHVPFAHWIVAATAPRALVELGTRTGVSYTAFYNAVARSGFSTRCHAVASRRADPQDGTNTEEAFEEYRLFHNEHFGGFSSL